MLLIFRTMLSVFSTALCVNSFSSDPRRLDRFTPAEPNTLQELFGQTICRPSGTRTLNFLQFRWFHHRLDSVEPPVLTNSVTSKLARRVMLIFNMPKELK